MADFNNELWSWLIGVVTVVSIIALIIFTLKLSGRKKKPGEQVESVGHTWDEDLYELNNPLPRWWKNMFLITLGWGLVYLFLYPGLGSYAGYLGWSQQSRYEAEIADAETEYGPIFARFMNEDLANLVTNQEALTIGKRLFSTYCTTCHGSDAGGAHGYPDLTDNDWQFGGDPESIKISILDGRQGIMPPWELILEAEGVADVTEYVKQLSGRESNGPAAVRGRDIYMTNCAACHAADGTGNPMFGAPDLSNDIWLYGSSEMAILESINKGRMGNMPPHREFLGEAKAHLLAAYVYSLSNQGDDR